VPARHVRRLEHGARAAAACGMRLCRGGAPWPGRLAPSRPLARPSQGLVELRVWSQSRPLASEITWSVACKLLCCSAAPVRCRQRGGRVLRLERPGHAGRAGVARHGHGRGCRGRDGFMQGARILRCRFMGLACDGLTRPLPSARRPGRCQRARQQQQRQRAVPCPSAPARL
jgi:hypothetical protein